MRVTISRRDTADTAIIAKLLLSQSSPLTPGPGTKVGCNCVDSKLDTLYMCSCVDTLGAGVGKRELYTVQVEGNNQFYPENDCQSILVCGINGHVLARVEGFILS